VSESSRMNESSRMSESNRMSESSRMSEWDLIRRVRGRVGESMCEFLSYTEMVVPHTEAIVHLKFGGSQQRKNNLIATFSGVEWSE
jgi:hypothetical protein